MTVSSFRIRALPAILPLDATVEVGTVTTLPAGSQATVENVGTPGAVVLDFALPQGAAGNDGAMLSVVAGSNITVDATDPAHPIIATPSIQTTVHAATGKTAPVDADELTLVDSAAAFALKNLTWANLKATLKTYLDTLYQPVGSYQTLAAPVTKTADFTVGSTDVWLINNKTGSGCVVTLPSAAASSGRKLEFKNTQAQTLASATSNVVPLTGGAAGTAILAATSGKWATLVSDGTNWVTMAGA